MVSLPLLICTHSHVPFKKWCSASLIMLHLVFPTSLKVAEIFSLCLCFTIGLCRFSLAIIYFWIRGKVYPFHPSCSFPAYMFDGLFSFHTFGHFKRLLYLIQLNLGPQIALLKILLAAAPTSKAKTDSINILADVLPEEMPWVSFLREKQMVHLLNGGDHE